MFDPALGRFLSMDPLSLDGANLLFEHPFVYARNCPTNLVDPSGLQPQKPTYKVCEPEFGKPTPSDPNNPPANLNICDPKGPGWYRLARDPAGNVLIEECFQEKKPNGPFVIRLGVLKPGKKDYEWFANCVYSPALNKLIGICDDKGNFVGLQNFNIGIRPNADITNVDLVNLKKACLDLDLSNSKDPMKDLRDCVERYIQKNFVAKKLTQGCGWFGNVPCVRQQVWPEKGIMRK